MNNHVYGNTSDIKRKKEVAKSKERRKKMFTRLHKLGLTMSYPATLLLLDTLGTTYDVKVIEWKEKTARCFAGRSSKIIINVIALSCIFIFGVFCLQKNSKDESLMTPAQNSSALYSNHDLSIASIESEFSAVSPEATLSDSSSPKSISPATSPPGPLRSNSPITSLSSLSPESTPSPDGMYTTCMQVIHILYMRSSYV